ncbi:MAG TPA: biotin carboxylase N-terminal domain-containing protein [Nocardioidaceae bacterium]|nr:biotin carboxylase N-terminal domain-containing protein [Nocardioidaceae bacterium]
MTVLRKVLMANRGEIARRVFRTCRDLGIGTVAVFSDADEDLPFVREADAAVRLPGTAPADTYLRGDLVVAAALRAGADAVHPGYGFLSENADFARRVLAAGLTWIGPKPESMEQMASKVEAKRLMAAAGVPVLTAPPPDRITGADLPLLVKASAGGGGRGMRVVRVLGDLERILEEASAEAKSSFGDSTVFCEPYVERGRHVEVQVVGDTHGNVLVLGERDCSVQRRHQKVVEETPAPGLRERTRSALHETARTAAAAIGYVGAGTLEFLLDDTENEQRFYFLEMNTRLQVEHPVTECVTGLDLVALQIAVAEGESLAGPSVEPVETRPRGHAVEARLYAEDPAHDWQPQSGTLARFDIPDVDVTFAVRSGAASSGVRLDAGFEAGNVVGTHYDPMLAKVIAWAPTRAQAVRRLAAVLARARIHGLRSTRDLLVEVLRHPAFAAGQVSTAFLADHALTSLESRGTPGTMQERARAFLAAAVAVTEAAAARRPVQQRTPVAWRNVVSAPQLTTFGHQGTKIEVGWYAGRDGYRLSDLNDEVRRARATSVRQAGPDCWEIVVEQDGVRHPFEVYLDDDRVDVESAGGHLPLTRMPRFVDPADEHASGSLLAPMPGTVVSVVVEQGGEVEAGQPVLVLEAMKMQHTVAAPHAGTITELPARAGQQVAAGAVLAVVSEDAVQSGEHGGDDE